MKINPVNRFFLYLLLLPAGLYRRMGVNMLHLKAVLNAKLIMDDRRPMSIQQMQQKKSDKPPRLATLGTMLMSAILGCIFLVGFAVGKEEVTKLTIYFSMYIFILASTLIADFTSVLIDVRDSIIILPKPINDKTFLLARLLHIVIHVSKMVIPMTLPGMIYEGVVNGFAGILPFIFNVLSASFFTIFLINAIYIFILQITTPAKFKAIISYFQIAIAIIFYGGYQLVPRLIGKVALANYNIELSSWKWLAPSYWFAESWQFLYHFQVSPSLLIAFIISLVLPGLSMWIVIRYFAPSFNSKLSMISGSDGEPVPAKAGNQQPVAAGSYASSMSGWLTQKGAERMSFLHTWKMTGRSREFKMKVYPSFGYLLVYIVIIFLGEKKTTFRSLSDPDGPGKFIFIGMLYFSGFMLIMALTQIQFSEKYKAAWIYYVTPIQKPGSLISGAIKSLLVKFYLPIVLVATVSGIVVLGPSIIPNLVLGVCNQVLVITCVTYIGVREIPFSSTQAMASKSGSFIKGLFSLIIPSILAVLHYILYSYLPVIILLIILSAIACWLVMDAIKMRSWKNIVMQNYE